MCVLFLSACPERKRYQKERDPGYVSGATPTLSGADGARTRFAQTDRPLPAPDSAYAYAPVPMPEGCAVECCAMAMVMCWRY
ncbi:hypothetical protein [Bacteroides cellulosilyticus]|uniref:Uncharacterized protein n=1 Tax=Bacteroides cellulosilyticus TaxID=246787 RepID=A0A5M6A4K6_9BACE|nr:hypothetical protein [Bacteroides cellulosilyticus]KAA5405205.1 hypothetical protein F2Y86_19960 [Bacteroides cellulosilyticus]